ncbi:MAG TPA: hypothetical protein VFZ47_06815 [Chitinophagaceae bacterium]
MASIAKKILSTFMEVSDDEKSPPSRSTAPPVDYDESPRYTPTAEHSAKFTAYFDKLFKDANLPGPDYFEFSKMIEAMSAIPDERSRYSAAFAGLNVQGLDKPKLLSTATEYLRILNNDAANFDSTVDATLQEKVHGKQKEISEKTARIEQLSKEIDDLRMQISRLNAEIKENEEKIQSNSGGYKTASEKMRARIESDIEKIKQHIH